MPTKSDLFTDLGHCAGAGAGLILGIQFFNNGITLVLSINLPTCVFREFPEHTTVTTLELQTILQFHNRFSKSRSSGEGPYYGL